MENKEVVVDALEVIKAVLGFVAVIAVAVAVFAVIWADWYVFRVALTVLVSYVMLKVAKEFIKDTLKKWSSSE